MAIFEFKCTNENCDNFKKQFEKICSFELSETLKCPICNNSLEKIINKSDFIIYGASTKNGWYPEKMNYDGTKADW